MNLGYTIVSMGWDFGATGFDSMKISVPGARNPGGSAITGPSYEYLSPTTPRRCSSLTYPAATLDKSQATLTVRARLDDPPVTVPESGSEYTSPAGTAIRCSGRNAVPAKRRLRIHVHGEESRGGCGRLGGAARLRFLSAARNSRRRESTRWRCRRTFATPSRSPHAP